MRQHPKWCAQADARAYTHTHTHTHTTHSPQVCVCANNPIGVRKQMRVLCAALRIPGDAFADTSVQKALRTGTDDNTLATILLGTRRELESAGQATVDRVPAAVCVCACLCVCLCVCVCVCMCVPVSVVFSIIIPPVSFSHSRSL